MNRQTEQAAVDQVEALLPELRSGSRQAFAAFVEAYSPYIYRLALRMLNDEQDAEDVLQETFIKAFQHLHRFDGRSKLSTWLYRIATNETLMLIRKRKAPAISLEEPRNGDEDELQEPLEIVDWTGLPEDKLMSGEAQDYLEQAVEKLSSNLRMVFLLREVEGLSTLETAQVLNLSEAAVKTRLSRARLMLREQLSAYFAERM